MYEDSLEYLWISSVTDCYMVAEDRYYEQQWTRWCELTDNMEEKNA